jgi:[ribosomal protein S18]-alanine N-acetyltransferase
MLEIHLFNENNKPNTIQKEAIINFLHQQLEQYGDTKEDIKKALDYALKDSHSFGGFVLQAFEDEIPACVVVVNKTGMEGYIPENILVYIATNNKLRGKGIGKQMMLKALEIAEGNVALHVEPDNPARVLYEKIGFTNKYLEMRYIKKN